MGRAIKAALLCSARTWSLNCCCCCTIFYGYIGHIGPKQVKKSHKFGDILYVVVREFFFCTENSITRKVFVEVFPEVTPMLVSVYCVAILDVGLVRVHMCLRIANY